MMELTKADWDALQTIAGRAGLAAERITLLRKRLENSAPRPGSPYTLLVGRPEAGIELVLARWLSPEAAEELKKSGERPLVIGGSPAEVQPRLGAFPTWKHAKYASGHLLALRVLGQLGADTLTQMASLGFVEQVVLVTRLGQPLHQHERDIARMLAGVAATARVLIVGLPGEEPTDADLAEVSAFAVSAMRQSGFSGGRCLGAGVWFTDEGNRPGTVPNLAAFLAIAPDQAAVGRAGMARHAISNVISELQKQAERTPYVPLPAVADDEQERLTRELANYLADLGKEVGRYAENRRPMTAEVLRGYALDALRGWGAYCGVEGHWLKYVERLRPGTQAGLITEAQAAVALLDYEQGIDSEPLPDRKLLGQSSLNRQALRRGPMGPIISWFDLSSTMNRLALEAKLLGIGFAFGAAGYLLVTGILTGQIGPTIVGLPPLVVTLLAYAALILGVVVGYRVGRFVLAPKERAQTKAAGNAVPGKEVFGRPAVVHGWNQVERRLLAWFGEHLRARAVSPAEECRALAQRLGVEVSDI